MEEYRTESKNNYKKMGYEKVINKLQKAPSRISDIESICYEVDNCECPSCLCHKAKFLLPLAPGGIAAATPVLMLATAAELAKGG